MPLFVHIAPEPKLKVILRNGVAPTAWRPDPAGHPHVDRVVWAFPVLASHTLTHSWARELKRFGRTTLAAVNFRVSDNQVVFACHFSDRPLAMTAAEAVGVIQAAKDPRGYEVMIPRRIRPGEIVRSRVLTRAFGWRYAPRLKGTAFPSCDCPVCLPRGEVKAAIQREQIWQRMRADGREPDNPMAGRPRGAKRKART